MSYADALDKLRYCLNYNFLYLTEDQREQILTFAYEHNVNERSNHSYKHWDMSRELVQWQVALVFENDEDEIVMVKMPMHIKMGSFNKKKTWYEKHCTVVPDNWRDCPPIPMPKGLAIKTGCPIIEDL